MAVIFGNSGVIQDIGPDRLKEMLLRSGAFDGIVNARCSFNTKPLTCRIFSNEVGKEIVEIFSNETDGKGLSNSDASQVSMMVSQCGLAVSSHPYIFLYFTSPKAPLQLI